MSAPLVEFPDAEGLIINWLPGALVASGLTGAAGVKVAGSKPGTGAESVVVYRTGGTLRDFLTDRPTVGFDVRAATATRCVAIISRVFALVNQLQGLALAGHAIDEVEVVRGVTSDPLPPEDPIRYSMLLTVTVRS